MPSFEPLTLGILSECKLIPPHPDPYRSWSFLTSPDQSLSFVVQVFSLALPSRRTVRGRAGPDFFIVSSRLDPPLSLKLGVVRRWAMGGPLPHSCEDGSPTLSRVVSAENRDDSIPFLPSVFSVLGYNNPFFKGPSFFFHHS